MMMQPHKAPSCISLFLLICLHCLVVQVSSLDTLKQGDELNSSSQLVSANGIFTLGFYTPRENYSYLAVWFTDFTDYSPYKPVWIGNREKPIPNNTSSVLTIGTKGELIITHDEGEAISLYAGGGSGQNVTATLLDTGNFVVKEMNSNGGEFLWQSFDDPTDTLLPGMKIGVNQRTRKNRTLTSWFGENNPAPGPFTLEWDPGAGKLLVRRRGVVYWTSGELKEYYDKDLGRVKEFENFLSRPDAFNFNYNLTNITSDEGEYFMYSLIQVPNLTPDQRKVISGWRMEYLGDIYDTDRGTVVRPSLCYGYKTTPRPNTPAGCEPWPQQHKCSDHRQMFEERSGNFKTGDNGPLLSSGTTYDGSSSLSESDCRDFCWKNCSCVGYRSAIGRPGCEYWIGKDFVFVQSVDGSALKQYVLVAASPGEGNKKLILIILTVASSIILLSLGITLLVLRKIKQRRREEELHELLRLDGQTDNCELENGGANSHDLKLFTYASIQSATNNFSSDKKLGQGGFGPVYKGRTQEGQDIAVKLLSRQSGQGLLEFKTELILISKLQHVNLV